MVRRIRRRKIIGTTERPRLSVFRSNSHIYAQIIDDFSGKTLVACSTLNLDLEKSCNVKAAETIGLEIAKKAKAKGLSKVVFDRGGFLYHGRIKSLADAARKGGLEF